MIKVSQDGTALMAGLTNLIKPTEQMEKAMNGWGSVINASEEDFNKLSNAILDSNGTSETMADTMMIEAKGAITEVKSALEGIANTIGEKLLINVKEVLVKYHQLQL